MRVGASSSEGFSSTIRIVSLCLYDSVSFFGIVDKVSPRARKGRATSVSWLIKRGGNFFYKSPSPY